MGGWGAGRGLGGKGEQGLFGNLIQLLDLPSVFMGETGVWKKITEETITTTRLTQFPTAWVTGETI